MSETTPSIQEAIEILTVAFMVEGLQPPSKLVFPKGELKKVEEYFSLAMHGLRAYEPIIQTSLSRVTSVRGISFEEET